MDHVVLITNKFAACWNQQMFNKNVSGMDHADLWNAPITKQQLQIKNAINFYKDAEILMLAVFRNFNVHSFKVRINVLKIHKTEIVYGIIAVYYIPHVKT